MAIPASGSDEVMIEHSFAENDEGFWIVIHVNREPYMELGPYDTAEERQRESTDILEMMRDVGAKDVPPAMQ